MHLASCKCCLLVAAIFLRASLGDRHDATDGCVVGAVSPGHKGQSSTHTVLGIQKENTGDKPQNPETAVVGHQGNSHVVLSASSAAPEGKHIPQMPMRDVHATIAMSPTIEHLNKLWRLISLYTATVCFVTIFWFTVSYREELQQEVETHVRRPKSSRRLSLPTEGLEDSSSDGGQFTQTGYCVTWLGSAVWFGWIGLFVLSQLEMAVLSVLFFETDSQDHFPIIRVFVTIFYGSAFSIPLLYGFLQEVHWFMAHCSLSDATHILIKEEDFEPKAFRGPAKVRRTLAKVETPPDNPAQKYFMYTCIVFHWDDTHHKFRSSGSTVLYMNRIPKEGLTSMAADSLLRRCRNVINVDVPTICQSLFTEFRNPMWLYQLYGCWLGFFWEDYLSALLWLILSVGAGVSQALLVHEQQTKVQQLVSLDGEAEVYRDGKWQVVKSSELVPRDRVRPKAGQVPCDCLIISGQAVVNESMLTGEPMPTSKSAFPPSDSEATIDPQQQKRHMLFAGTELIQTDGAICIATATGAMTQKGQLVRMVLFPSPVYFKFVNDLPYAMVVLALYALVCSAFIITSGPPGPIALLMNGFLVIQSFSPLVLISFVAGQSAAAKRIELKGMGCLAPARCQVAGKLHLVVFDKTGTLTESGMSIVGLQPADHEEFEEIQWVSDPGSVLLAGPLWPVALASCHSLTQVGGRWVGPDIEVHMLEASGWSAVPGEQRIFRAPGPAGSDSDVARDSVEVLRVLEFDHHRTTSGALVRITRTGSSESQTMLFVKGSYEKLATFCQVSSSYADVTTGLASEGFYVLALACRSVAPAEVGHLMTAPRGKLETGLELMGLLLFRNELKADTTEALAELHRGDIRTVMCTGDNVFTGANVARQCGMLGPSDLLIYCDVINGALEWFMRASDGGVQGINLEDVIYQDSKFAVTGAAYKELVKNKRVDHLLPRTVVFGRMRPEDKRDLVIRYQEYNLVVGMCGDGGNDCAALRAAHVGVALSESEASIVAPFSSGPRKSVHCVVHVAKVGRACLATNIACYRYCIIVGLSWTFSKVVLMAWCETLFSQWTLLLSNIVVQPMLTFGIIWCCVEHDQLAPHRQQSSLFAAETVLGIGVPHCLFVSAWLCLWWYLHQQKSWFEVMDSYFLSYFISDAVHFWHAADQYIVECVFLLFLFYSVSMALASSFGGHYRSPVHKRGIVVQVIGCIAFGLILLFTGPNALTCLMRINCTNQVSLNSYIPIITEISIPKALGDCFYGPQAQRWKPYLINSDPPNTPHARRCYPPTNSGLSPAQMAIEPNNVLPMDFRLKHAGFSSLLCIVCVGFKYFMLEPLSSILRGSRPKAFMPPNK